MVKKKPGILALCILFLCIFTLACGNEVQESDISRQAFEMQRITYNLGTEPETLDPAAATGAPEGTVQLALFEGLVRLDKNNRPVPGMAKKWKISDNGRKYVFYLRDAEWSNGDPVTAYDFEYAWKRLLNPELAHSYAYQLYYLKNGEAYNGQKAKAEDVGVKALDSKTLIVELNQVTPYFLSLTAFPALYPVNKKVVEKHSDWHASPENFISNGPFKLVKWEHDQKLVLEKNPNYWAADDVKLNTIIMTMVGSDDTELTMFETDQIDIAENPPFQEMARLLAEKKAAIYPDLSVDFYVLNTDKKPLNDVRVRKALSLAINRRQLIDNVTQAYEKPAFALVPFGVTDIKNRDFRKNGGNYFQEDVEQAQKLLADAGFPNGKNFPVLKISYNEREAHQKVSEAIQEMWKANLGINVKLVNREWKVYGNAIKTGDFDIIRAGWVPDYDDAMTYLDLWAKSGFGMFYTGWENTEYDKLILAARENSDLVSRSSQLHQAEAILMEEMVIIPLFFCTNQNMYKPWVKGVVVPTLGAYQEFRWAYIEK
ncbi:MAG: peptide ABC transporter substrate-binding protein [Bacillota bacterium]|jgi:oligopeptide transport system substrate-binding protein